jgi:nitroreductase
MRAPTRASRLEPPGRSAARFVALVAATAADRTALKGPEPTASSVRPPSSSGRSTRRHEPGLRLSHGRAILLATDLGLGTCWLGGTFSKSSFARKIGLAEGELMPAVTAVGYPVDGGFSKDRIRKMAGSNFRRPPEELFFDADFCAPLSPADAGAYAGPLEMVRWAPSASNRQPWRIVRTPTGWHFFLARTKGYGKGTLLFSVLRLADLQRVDMGIAMCHFELAAREAGLAGGWVIEDPGTATPLAGLE